MKVRVLDLLFCAFGRFNFFGLCINLVYFRVLTRDKINEKNMLYMYSVSQHGVRFDSAATTSTRGI